MTLEVYGETKRFPGDGNYGLTSQIRRAAISIPSNIAEGYGRKSTKEYIQSLSIAYGSLCELETQILLAGDLAYLQTESLQKLLQEIGDIERMLMALIKSLKRRLEP